MEKPISSFKYSMALILLSLFSFGAIANESLPEIEIIAVADFSKLARVANDQQKLIMLEISATYCSYCRKLEAAIIKPMLRSGDYEDRVLIRKIEIDEETHLINFDGSTISPGRLAQKLDIKVTPTIIFLNSQNQEVSERIVGVNSLDYFGGYVDDAIDHGLVAIR
jgi:thioredoxin-related protein